MNIKVLIENDALNEHFRPEHGLSMAFELDNRLFLFDTGQSDQFLINATKLNVDLHDVEALFLSHAHYDHLGGLTAFFQVNKSAAAYLHRKAFGNFWARRPDGTLKDIGLKFDTEFLSRIRPTEGTVKIYPHLTLFSGTLDFLYNENDKNKKDEFHSEANDVLLENIDGVLHPDRFEHEQNLLIETPDNQLVLLAGCAHSGIVNIINRAEEVAGRLPDVVIGGFHLMNPNAQKMIDQNTVDQIGERLRSLPCRYYTGHCTGSEAFDRLHRILGERIEKFFAGSVIEIK